MIDRFKSDPNLKRLKKAQKARERANQEKEQENQVVKEAEAPPLMIRYVKKQAWQRKSHG